MRRRTFLLAGLGAGGALVLGWSLTPPRQRLYGSRDPVAVGGGVALNGWLAIAPDDTVTVFSPKAEMGQGIHTALAMLVAEELDADWSRVRVQAAPIDRIYNNIAAIVDGLPFHEDQQQSRLVRSVRWFTAKTMRDVGVMMTGGSSSVRDVWEVAREAGATARTALVMAAAERLGVSPDMCRTERGTVRCGDTVLRYGELVTAAAAQRPSAVTLKPTSAFTLIGTDVPRLDGGAKSRGAPMFGIDVVRPGMRYAAVTMAPAFESRVASVDERAALARPGVRAVIPIAGSRYGDAPAVAVVADSWWQARQALAALNVEWTSSPHATLGSDEISHRLHLQVLHGGGLPYRSLGNAVSVVEQGERVVEATYEAPYLAHATLEPMNATVLVHDDGAELWTGTQVPGVARAAVAHVTGLRESTVVVHEQALGGGFGRRLEADYVAQAAAIANVMRGTPVQLIWSREDDMRHDFYRPAAVGRLRAALDADGRVQGIVTHSVSQAPFKMLSRRIGIPVTPWLPDKTTAEGTWDQPYEFPAIRSSHQEMDLPVPVGSWRSVGHSHMAFFLESFLDELAHTGGHDPLAFRLALLERHPRAAAVLRRAAEAGGWGTPCTPPPGGAPRARGLAMHRSFETVVAQVAEVSISSENRIQVHRIVSVVDAGLVVNPSGVRQQVESGVIDGLSSALLGEVVIESGRVRPGNFHQYPLLRMSDCPVIDTIIMPSSEHPSGVGEPALPPVAPAVANAIFALTGTRLRTLPLRMPAQPAAAGPTANEERTA
jgi:isoquinoline 1-oxidoreductase subunit beta